MVLGSAIIATGILIALATAIPTGGLGVGAGAGIATAGAAVLAAGEGLFYHGCRKGSSRAAEDLAEELKMSK